MIQNIEIIAELANAHEGSADRLFDLIRAAKSSGATAVKFQIFYADELIDKSAEKYPLFKGLEFSEVQWRKAFALSEAQGLRIYADVYGDQSVALVERLHGEVKLTGVKIPASDSLNIPLVKTVAERFNKILLSAGGNTDADLQVMIDAINKISAGKDIVLMQGFQAYPTSIADTNLHEISRLRQRFQLPVGVMEHLDGSIALAKTIPLAAVALGANHIEKHITLNRSAEGIDFYSSLDPDDFAGMVQQVNDLQLALGKPTDEKLWSDAEKHYRNTSRKKVIFKRDIPAGTEIDVDAFYYSRTDDAGASPNLNAVIGKRARTDIGRGTVLLEATMESLLS